MMFFLDQMALQLEQMEYKGWITSASPSMNLHIKDTLPKKLIKYLILFRSIRMTVIPVRIYLDGMPI